MSQPSRDGDMRNGSKEILFLSFLLEAIMTSSARGSNVHSVQQHFFCLQDARKDGFERQSCHRRVFASSQCQKRFLWARKEIDLAPHPVICLLTREADIPLREHTATKHDDRNNMQASILHRNAI